MSGDMRSEFKGKHILVSLHSGQDRFKTRFVPGDFLVADSATYTVAQGPLSPKAYRTANTAHWHTAEIYSRDERRFRTGKPSPDYNTFEIGELDTDLLLWIGKNVPTAIWMLLVEFSPTEWAQCYPGVIPGAPSIVQKYARMCESRLWGAKAIKEMYFHSAMDTIKYGIFPEQDCDVCGIWRTNIIFFVEEMRMHQFVYCRWTAQICAKCRTRLKWSMMMASYPSPQRAGERDR